MDGTGRHQRVARSRRSRPAAATTSMLAAVAGLASLALLPWLSKPAFPDESASLVAAGLSWTALWRHAHVVDLVLVPYYSLLHLWTQQAGGIEWARCLSLLAFGLTVFLVGLLGVRLGGRWCGVLAATLAATNPLLVTAALSARPYALSALAATAAVIALFRWLGGGGSRWAWWFCAACVAAMLLHLFAILAPLSVLAATIALKPAMFSGRASALVAPVGLVLGAALALAFPAAGQRSQIGWIPSPFEGVQLTRAVEGPASGGRPLYAVLMLALACVTTGVCLWARRHGGRGGRLLDLRLLGILWAWAAVPTVALVAGSLARPVFLDRYVTSSVPGLALALALPAACALGTISVRGENDRSRIIVQGIVWVWLAAGLFLAFAMPAARLTYREAISRGPVDDARAAIGAATAGRMPHAVWADRRDGRERAHAQQ